MSPSKLTPHDAGVLSKIKDPESSVSPILIDENVRRDPHILDTSVYDSIVKTEKAIVQSIIDLQKKELSRTRKNPKIWGYMPDAGERAFRTKQTSGWLTCIIRLDHLIKQYPTYASAMNNRAQAMRVVYGDGMLVKLSTEGGSPVSDGMQSVMDEYSKDHSVNMKEISTKVLDDLSAGIRLLSPLTPFSPVSPTQAKTLANLYIQRGILYRAAAQKLARHGELMQDNVSDGMNKVPERLHAEVRIKGKSEGSWSRADFEQNASMEFFMAGRFGSDIGKGLAVSTNPDAKLCGQIVAEAMRKEIAGEDDTSQKVAAENIKPKVGTDEDIEMGDITDADATLQNGAGEPITITKVQAVDAMIGEFADATMEEEIGEQPIKFSNANEEKELHQGMNAIEGWET